MRKILISLSLMLMALSSNLFAQEITPGKEVDLGLPSGTIWAGWNVGALSPEEYGDFYPWGEIEEIRISESDGYSHKFWVDRDGDGCKTLELPCLNISGTKYDVARQKWGGSWRMPTKAEFDELTSKCTWTWYQYKGVWGQKVTGPNGNSIFLPAADFHYGTNESGNYWTASYHDAMYSNGAFCLLFREGGVTIYSSLIDSGYSIRPVKSK